MKSNYGEKQGYCKKLHSTGHLAEVANSIHGSAVHRRGEEFSALGCFDIGMLSMLYTEYRKRNEEKKRRRRGRQRAC